MALPKPGPIPTPPDKITLPLLETPPVKEIGEFQVTPATTFYFSSIQNIWLWWLVDLKTLKNALRKLPVTPYDFGGKGAVNVNFFSAATSTGIGKPGNRGVAGFTETEVNAVAFASGVADKVPRGLTFKDFLTTGDPTKRIGNMRLWVACDDPIAAAAGRQTFYETTKFVVGYTYNLPVLNNPKQRAYTWTCHDPEDPSQFIYKASADLSGLVSTPSNMSEWVDLSVEPSTGRPVGSRRNYFGVHTTYHLPRGYDKVTLATGASTHRMKETLDTLIGTRKPKAVQTFTSPPCIAEAVGYYADL